MLLDCRVEPIVPDFISDSDHVGVNSASSEY